MGDDGDTRRHALGLVLGALGASVGCTASSPTSVNHPQPSPTLPPKVEGLRVVETFTMLSGLAGRRGDAVLVLGRTRPADGGGGLFVWDLERDAADGGSVLPSVPDGCWRRMFSGALDARWFGVVGDGIHDDGPALQAAIDAAGRMSSRHGTVWLPGGTFAVLHPLQIPGGVSLVGSGNRGNGCWSVLRYAGPADTDAVTMSCLGNDAGGNVLENLIVARDAADGGVGIHIHAWMEGATLHRPANILLRNILVTSVTRKGALARFRHGLLIDGRAAGKSGDKGVRSIHLTKVRVADCSATSAYVLLRQATHVVASGLQIDPGVGELPAGLRVEGETRNVELAGLICNGDVTLQGAHNFHLLGHVGGKIDVADDCTNVGGVVDGMPFGGAVRVALQPGVLKPKASWHHELKAPISEGDLLLASWPAMPMGIEKQCSVKATGRIDVQLTNGTNQPIQLVGGLVLRLRIWRG